MKASAITIKTEQDIEKLRISGRLAAQVLEMIGEYVKPGVSTEYLDDICNDFIVNTLKVIPANVGYYGYTKTTCISPNEVVCHGIPSATTILQDGDIINIDVAIIKDGYFGDTSRMYYVVIHKYLLHLMTCTNQSVGMMSSTTLQLLPQTYMTAQSY